jgi:long-chain fatty acid transport protein
MKTCSLFLVSLFMVISVAAQSGHVMNGVGPIDQGMAGSGMAAPQDALTALHWNPASILALPGRSFDVGLQLMMPTGSLSSTVQQGAFGPMGPSVTLTGTSDSDAGPFPVPSVGFIQNSPDKPYAWGISVFGVGGFGVDYELSAANPLLTPQMPDGGMGFGAMSSTFMLMQISPTIAYRFNDAISIGIAPTINFASLELSVFPGTAPTVMATMPDGTPLVKYPDAPADWSTGFGFQAGIQADLTETVHLGLSYKSKQSFSDFEYDPELAGAADFTFRLDYPMILSAGLAYTGLSGLNVAADVRYIDFENTEGFDETGFDATGAVKGFGWSSVVVASIGAQYAVTDDLTVRAGYGWNDSPIEGAVAFYNSPAPALITNRVAGGLSYAISEKVVLSVAGQYGMKADVTGEWKNPMFPGGSNPFTSVTHELSTLTFIMGVHVSL